MAEKKIGKQTVKFEKCPYVIGSAAVGGEKEGAGPMRDWFDSILEDDMNGEKTWEKAESKMLKDAMLMALKKSGREKKEIDLVLSGDLLNQIMSSSFMARDLHLPVPGPVRGVFHHDRVPAAGLHAHRRRLCTQYHRRRVQPFLHSGTAVPHAAGTRQSKAAFGSVDRHRGRSHDRVREEIRPVKAGRCRWDRGPAARVRRSCTISAWTRHHREDHRCRRQGRQPDGQRHGAGRQWIRF